MKITFEKQILETAVNSSLCAVSDKNTYPALEGIRFKCEKGEKCLITTYDLNKGFIAELDCECEEGGNYIINAVKLNRIIRILPDNYVTIYIDNRNITTIESGKSKFELTALDGNNFPNLPELLGDDGFEISSSVLKKAIGQVFFAIALTDQRPTLCGAFFEISENKMKVTACDGNRLATREIECELNDKTRNVKDTFKFSFIVPGKTLAQLSRLLGDGDDKITIHLGRKHAIFRIDNTVFFSRLIDGDYIDYTRVIPKDMKICVTVNRMAFISSLERASLITEEKLVGQVKGYVKCVFEDDMLKISSTSVSGSVYDEFPIAKEGSDLTIGFNCRYLLEALKSADGENIKIMMASALLSIIIVPDENENQNNDNDEKEKSNYLYMVCPVRMN